MSERENPDLSGVGESKLEKIHFILSKGTHT